MGPTTTFVRWLLADGAQLADVRARLGDRGDRLAAAREAEVGGRRAIDLEDVGDGSWLEPARGELAGVVDAIWLRRRALALHPRHRDADDVDAICELGGGGWRPCRYGFDELRITGARERMPGVAVEADHQRWRGAGSYLARNCLARELAEVSVQINEPHRGEPIARAEPLAVMKLIGTGRYDRVEWCWRGRIVHVAAVGGLRESRDGWDNCVDDMYVAQVGGAEPRPAEVYAGDR